MQSHIISATMDVVYPASPSWYCSRVLDSNVDGILIFGAKNSLYIYDIKVPKKPEFIRHLNVHEERVVGVSLCKPITALPHTVTSIAVATSNSANLDDAAKTLPGDDSADVVCGGQPEDKSADIDSHEIVMDKIENVEGSVSVLGVKDSSKTIESFSSTSVTSKSASNTTLTNTLRACTIGEEGKMKVWDLNKGKLIVEHSIHRGRPTVVHWSPVNTDLIASGDEKGTVVLYCLKSKEGWTWHPESPHTNVVALEFSPHSNNRLAVGFKTGAVFVVDVARPSSTIVARLRGHDEEINTLSWCPVGSENDPTKESESLYSCSSSDLLATSCRGRTVRVWNVAKCQTMQVLRIPGQNRGKERVEDGGFRQRSWIATAWPRGNKYELISSGVNGEIIRWNLCDHPNKKFQIISSGRGGQMHNRVVYNIAVVDGNPTVLVSISMDRQIILWDLSASQSILSIPSLGGYVYSIAQSPLDPCRYAVGGGDNLIRLCSSVEPYNVQTLWQGIRSKVTALAWQPAKEGVLAYGTEDGRVGIINVLTSKAPIISSTYHRKTVYVVAWGVSLHRAASNDATERGKEALSLYSVGDGIIYEHFVEAMEQKHAKDITKLLVKAGSCSTRTVEESADIETRSLTVLRTELSWNSDLSHFAVGNDDGTIEIFSVQPHLALACVIRVHRKLVNCIRWHPKFTGSSTEPSQFEYLIATGSNEANVHVFNLRQVIGSKTGLSVKVTAIVPEASAENDISQDKQGESNIGNSDTVVCASSLSESGVVDGENLGTKTEKNCSVNIDITSLSSSSMEKPSSGAVRTVVPTITESFRCLEGHSNRITALSWSVHEDGLLASASYDWTVQVWDIKQRNTVPVTVKLNESLNSDKNRGVGKDMQDGQGNGASSSGNLNVKDLENGKERLDVATCVTLESNNIEESGTADKQQEYGEKLQNEAETKSDNKEEVARNGHEVANFRGHHGRVMALAWSAVDSDVVYSGADDYTFMAWRISRQNETRPPNPIKKKSRGGRTKTNTAKKTQPVASSHVEAPVAKWEEIEVDDGAKKEEISEVLLVEDEKNELLALLASKRQTLMFRNGADQERASSAAMGASSGAGIESEELENDDENDDDDDVDEIISNSSDKKSTTSVTAKSCHSLAAFKKKKASKKSLFPLANSADNRGKQPTQLDCVELARVKFSGASSVLKGARPTNQTTLNSTVSMLSNGNVVVSNRTNIHAAGDCNGSGSQTRSTAEIGKSLGPQNTPRPDSVLGRHLGCFVDRRSATASCKDEEQRHRERRSFDNLAMLQVFRGVMGEGVGEALEGKRLDDFIVAMAAGVSLELWETACESYSKQLAGEGEYHKAASYLVSINKIHDAIALLKQHSLYRDAVSLARLRLSPSDSTLKELTIAWGQHLLRDGNYETAAKCFISAGEAVEAASCLARRADRDSLKNAAMIALLANQNEVSYVYAQKYVLEGLVTGDWEGIGELISQSEKFEYLGMIACAYMILVDRLACDDIKCSLFTTTPPQPWISLPSAGSNNTESHHIEDISGAMLDSSRILPESLKNLEELFRECGDGERGVAGSGDGKREFVNGRPLALHVVHCWVECCGVKLEQTDLLNEYTTRLCAIRRGQQPSDAPTRRIVTSSLDLSLAILHLLYTPPRTNKAIECMLSSINEIVPAIPEQAVVKVLRLLVPFVDGSLLEMFVRNLQKRENNTPVSSGECNENTEGISCVRNTEALNDEGKSQVVLSEGKTDTFDSNEKTEELSSVGKTNLQTGLGTSSESILERMRNLVLERLSNVSLKPEA